MLNHYRSIRRQDRKGFTLIELMVVLLIMAILLAIAIPIFLGVTGGANDRAVEGNLNTALTTAKTAYQTNTQSYTGVSNATLTANEPSLTFTAGSVTTPGNISDWVSTDGNGIILATPSKNGAQCLWVVDNPAVVTGNATTNGAYTRLTTGPGTATSAPTAIGDFYGVSAQVTGACNAGNASLAGATWGSSFGAIGH